MKPLPESSSIAIAAVVDRAFLAGLHVMLRSLLNTARRPADVHLYVFHEDCSTEDLRQIQATVDNCSPTWSVELTFSAADLDAFAHFRKLQGSLLPYQALVVPELVSESRLLLLDADLLILSGLDDWLTTPFAEPIAAVSFSSIGEALASDRDLLVEKGYDLADPYFNTGVVTIDCDWWETEQLTDRCPSLRQLTQSSWPLLTSRCSTLC